MMEFVFLLGGFILALSFGRNILGNVFGSAIGTGMLSLRLCAVLMALFVTLGAFYGSGEVAHNMVRYIHFEPPVQVLYFSLLLAGVIFLLTYFGLPLSVAQLGMGALAGWNLATGGLVQFSDILDLVKAWIFSPLIAGMIAFFVFKLVRIYLKVHPVALLNRDLWVRFHMIWIGCLMAYTIGGNNLSVVVQPFVRTLSFPDIWIKSSICVFVFAGCLLASRRVVKTVSRDLFPLSPLEAMITAFAGSMTLFLFSQGFSFLPAIPVSSGASFIGGIVGISLAKGGYGLKIKPLAWVACSWLWAPFLSGLTCFVFVSMMRLGSLL